MTYRLYCGRVLGDRASTLLLSGLKTQYPGVDGGRQPVQYDDCVAHYLIMIERARKFSISEAREIIQYVRGAVDMLVAMDITRHVCHGQGEMGRVDKV